MFKLCGIFADPHALASAACGCLDHDRISHLIGSLPALQSFINRIFGPRHNRNTRFHHRLSGRRFIPHLVNDFCGRPDKGYVALFTHADKLAVLR